MTGYDQVATAILRPFAKLWFLWCRALRHDLFVRQRGLPGRRAWLWPFGVAARAWGVLLRCWRRASTAAALEAYAGALACHYGPQGLAYGHLSCLDTAASAKKFAEQRGRIRFYLSDRRVLDFADGDSFLDCGCGPGQNVVELRRTYPRSPIAAFDVNAAAVAVVKAGTADDPLTQVELGSVLDKDHWAKHGTASVDHVLISHVLGFLVAPTMVDTMSLRQMIVDEAVRIARHSVIVLDAAEIKRSEISVAIEQRDRGIVHDDLTRYFQTHAGEGQLYVMISLEDEAIIFRKSGAAVPAERRS